MIFLVTTLLMLVGLGAVAVHNFWGEKNLIGIKILPDQLTPVATPAVSVAPTTEAADKADWKVFKSKDQSFRFRYPPSWQVVETSSALPQTQRKSLGVVVQSWALTNFSSESDSLSKEAIKIDFEISMEGRKESLESLLSCDNPNVTECKNLEINGVTYKKVVVKSPKGAENTALATVKDDRIYHISGTLDAEKNERGKQAVEEVMKTFEILQSS
jgi:hypothetical protein